MIALLLATALAWAVPLDEVLRSVEAHHPSVLAALADIEAAEAGRLSAAGGFDPRLTAAAGVQRGPYDNHIGQVKLSQPTRALGADLSAGWVLGEGDFPSYSSASTASGGEWQLGVAVPLLQDRAIDARRAAVVLAEVDLGGAEARAELVRLQLARDATLAWLEWRAAGEQLALAETLLAQAEARQAWIGARAEAGDLPAIDVADNRRTVLSRRGDLADAVAQVARARAVLALYLRDADARPRDAGAPPASGLAEVAAPGVASLVEDAAAARASHPRVRGAQASAEAAGVRVEVARNQLLPVLDLTGGLEREVVVASAAPTEVKAGVQLAVPLPQRTARGQSAAAQAREDAALAALALTADQVEVELRRAFASLEAAAARVALLRESVALARQVEAAERSLYEAGDSTLLAVVLREQSRAEVERALIRAEQAWRAAWADYQLARGTSGA